MILRIVFMTMNILRSECTSQSLDEGKPCRHKKFGPEKHNEVLSGPSLRSWWVQPFLSTRTNSRTQTLQSLNLSSFMMMFLFSDVSFIVRRFLIEIRNARA